MSTWRTTVTNKLHVLVLYTKLSVVHRYKCTCTICVSSLLSVSFLQSPSVLYMFSVNAGYLYHNESYELL